MTGLILKSPMPKWRLLRRIQSPWPTLEKAPFGSHFAESLCPTPANVNAQKYLDAASPYAIQGKFRPDWTHQIGRNNNELLRLVVRQNNSAFPSLQISKNLL